MTPLFDDIRRQTLERERTQRIEEYEAVRAQAGRALDAVTRLRLQREADDLEKQIRQIELDLAAIAKPDYPSAGDAEEIPQTPKPTGQPPLGDALTVAPEHHGRPYTPNAVQWWIRLKVESNQKVQKCQGQIYDILKLENEEDAVGKHLPAAQVTTLSWADGNFNPISLAPYETQYLDLAWRTTDRPQFDGSEMRVTSSRVRGLRAPESPAWGNGHDFIQLDPGYYLLVVRFLAPGFAPLERRFRLHWPGPGKEDEILLTAVTETPNHKPMAEQSPPHSITPPSSDRPANTPPAQRQSPDNGSSTGVVEMALHLTKKWLWAQFLLSIFLPVVGFSANLGGVLDLSLSTRLTIFILSVLLLGGAFLAISFLPALRANYQHWDRGLTGFLLIVIVTILVAQYPSAKLPEPLPPTPPPTEPPTPTMTPTATALPIRPVQPGVLIHFDDFEANTTNWRTWSDSNGRAWYDDGSYHIRSFGNTRGWLSVKGNDIYIEMIIEVDATPVTHELVTGYAVAFGWSQGYNSHIFEVQNGGDCGFVEIDEGRRSGGLILRAACPKPAQNETVRIRLEVDREKVRAFVNGVFVSQMVWETENPYIGGNIGLGVYNGGQLGADVQAQARFDNMAIWRFQFTPPPAFDG